MALFSRTLMDIISPCSLRSSGSSPRPSRIAPAGERGLTGTPVQADLAFAKRVESEQRRAQFASPGAHQSGDAQHFAPAQLERHAAKLAVLRGRRRRAADRRKAHRLRMPGARCPVRAPPSCGRASAAWSADISTVPSVNPSRSTVARSQIRKISSILCDT